MNFVFFFADEMSASSVSCYGNPVARMPNFDRLARESVRFENCFVQNPVCSPSRCSLMTGWYVHNRGHRSLWNLLKPTEPNLLRYLKNSNYDVQWFGKNDLFSAECVKEICSDYDEKRTGYKTEPGRPYRKEDPGAFLRDNAFQPGEAGYYSFLFKPMADDETKAPLLVEEIARAIDYLENRREGDRPFMLYLPLSLPHPPYHAPRRFHEMYGPAEVQNLLISPEGLKNCPPYMNWIRKYRKLDRLSPELMARIYAVYLGMGSYVDFLLGKLMDVMEEKGLFDNTTLIVSSDHGDWAGNYGLVEKWPNAMDDFLLHVPLLIKTPGGEKDRVLHEQVELFDIMPTVLELAGVECGHSHFARSLVPQLHGAPGDPDRKVFAEGGYDRPDVRCFENLPRGAAGNLMDRNNIYYPKALQQQEHPESVCRTAMVRSAMQKLVLRTSGENELYDLQKDPWETHNVIADPEYSGRKKELESEMLLWYIRTADTVPFEEDNRWF